MQAAGRDVRAAAELAAGVQLRGDDLDTGQAGARLLVGGDSATVVVDLDRAVGVEQHLDTVRRAGQRLVDTVVDDLPHAVHEAAGVGGPDVHARPLAHRLQALEDEEVGGVVGVVGDLGAPLVLALRGGLGCLRHWPESSRRHAVPGSRHAPAPGSSVGSLPRSTAPPMNRSTAGHVLRDVTMWTRSGSGSGTVHGTSQDARDFTQAGE